jgi:DNA polymerase-1
MIMQVHDELVFEVAAGDTAALLAEVTAQMAAAGGLNIELIVDTGIGDNWDQAH